MFLQSPECFQHLQALLQYLAGKTSVTVQTTALSTTSRIFVTPDSPVAIGAKKINSNTFKVTIPSIQAEDVKVNWWIVN